MRSQLFRFALAAGGCLGAVFLLLAGMEGFADDAKKDAASPSKATEGDDCYKFVAPLTSVMEVMDDVFQKMPEKLKAGKWKDLRRESHFVAEVANLSTHVKEHRTDKDWLGLLESLKSSALKMAEAAEKKDENGVKMHHSKAEESCDSCHEKFRDVP